MTLLFRIIYYDVIIHRHAPAPRRVRSTRPCLLVLLKRQNSTITRHIYSNVIITLYVVGARACSAARSLDTAMFSSSGMVREAAPPEAADAGSERDGEMEKIWRGEGGGRA